jgi:uncharacterized protein YbaR (Trm112 family)/ubiquinone/menaquinone biosynthesis C-methylase UbiE
MTNALTDLLACPRCDKPLDAVESGWHCSGCDVEFPLVGGVPWLFAEPTYAFAEWRHRLDFMLRQLGGDVERFDATLSQREDLLPETRERLEAIRSAVAAHAERLGGLLEPLRRTPTGASIATYLALRTRLPPDQGLLTYYPNLHRDWCWGDEENAAAEQLLEPGLTGLPANARILVLGSGAGRLAYDIHRRHAPAQTVALDFNPLFQLAAARIAAGETLELYEFPLAPRTLGDHAVLRRLAAPEAAGPGFCPVLGDALRAPFRDAAFDVVVTPWLIDILPGDFAELCPRINRLLTDQGRWLNLGSLVFAQAAPEAQYSPTECVRLIEAAGFATPELGEAAIPYMCSPASRHGRRETVIYWSAKKTARARRPARYQALPEWLVKGTDPVPLLEPFQMQAASTRIYAGIMSLIDGRRSLRDIAKILVDQRLIGAGDAEAAIREFLTKMFNEAERGRRL